MSKEKKKELKKLKPFVFVENIKGNYTPRTYAQNILLKAISEGVTSIKELRKISGMKSAADVYRTLDKLAIRKEYHEALAKNGISLDYIINGLKDIADSSESDSTRLASLNILLKSLGLDKYEKVEDSGKNWEDALLTAITKEKEVKSIEGKIDSIEGELDEKKEYEVIEPVIPNNELKKQEDENELAKMLYSD